MITYLDIEDLLDFRSPDQPIISFYLNTDGSRFSLDQQRAQVKNLIRKARKSAETGNWDSSVQADLLEDVDRIESFLRDELAPGFHHRGVSVFVCKRANLWRVFQLPRSVPSNLMLEFTPYIRPLTLILDEYHRFGVLLLDRGQAELYEVYIGEIIKVENAFPATGAAAVLAPIEGPGSADRGISRRGEEEMQRHFRSVADTLFHQFTRRHYEYLVLGGQQQILAQFENFLHPVLYDKMVGRFAAEPGKFKPAKILDEISTLEKRVETENEKKLVKNLINTTNNRGFAVLGLEQVLHALQRGAVHMLLVEEGWHTPGMRCLNCDTLNISAVNCPECGKDVVETSDIVDDAIELALRTGSMIEHVNSAAGLSDQGHIGAILRFKI
ncbi:MAG: hypothetical protein ABH878_01850 [bacterium]